MMDPAQKKRWVEALRSGKYKQTQAALCDIDSGAKRYCCLGVAAILDPASEWREELDASGNGWGGIPLFEICEDDADIREYYDEEFWCPPGVPNEVATELAEMNDSGRSFAEIADRIEAHPEI